jgi:hypothetical protein
MLQQIIDYNVCMVQKANVKQNGIDRGNIQYMYCMYLCLFTILDYVYENDI